MKRVLLGLIVMLSMVSTVYADTKSVYKNLREKYPHIPIFSLENTPILNLYSGNLNGQVVYVSEDAEYIMLSGNMIRLKDGQNLTESLNIKFNKVDWNSLPLDDAIKIVQGTGKRKLAIFSDPNCPYCKKLEVELAKLNNVTIYLFITAFHPESVQPSQSVWCSTDSVKAWKKLISKNEIPVMKICENPIQRNLQLAQKLDIQGTPSIVMQNGYKISGVKSAQELETLMGKSIDDR